MKEKTLPKELLSLKKKTSWSWEKMCRDFHRVMGVEGPSHTTLFRYATGKVKRRNVLTERFVREAIHKITVELSEKELHESETRREHVEKDLHQTEDRFRQLVEKAKDIIYRFRLAPQRGFEYISPSVTDILGYTPEEFYADPELSLKIVHPDDRKLLQSYFQGKAPSKPVTLRGVHKDGSIVWVEETVVRIYDEAGHLVFLEGISRDITERKRMEGSVQER